MARVTVEDCVERVPNRFDLVMYAAQRARDIANGSRETVPRDNDKNPVIALREIADQTLELPELEESLVRGLQKHQPFDDDLAEDEEMSVPALQGDAGADALDAAIDQQETATAEPEAEEKAAGEEASAEDGEDTVDEDVSAEDEATVEEADKEQ